SSYEAFAEGVFARVLGQSSPASTLLTSDTITFDPVTLLLSGESPEEVVAAILLSDEALQRGVNGVCLAYLFCPAGGQDAFWVDYARSWASRGEAAIGILGSEDFFLFGGGKPDF